MSSPENNLDPDELFAFLDEHDQYPVSGLSLASEARQEDAAPELVEFFQALPTVEDESAVVKHAVDPKESPLGQTLDLDARRRKAAPEPNGTLEIKDIVDQEP